jgi:hypothetical protein
MFLLKDLFKSLNSILGIQPIELNKSSAKTYYLGFEPIHSKGVANDFIRIYKTGLTNSFSFAFNGLDKDKGTITVTWMTKDTHSKKNTYKSRIYKFPDFKNQLKIFVQTLLILKNSNALTFESRKETFMSVFDIKNALSDNKQLFEDAISTISSESEDLKEIYNSSLKKFNKSSKKIDHIDKLLKLKYDELFDDLGLEKLYAEIKEKEEILSNEISKVKKKHSYKKIKDSHWKLKHSLSDSKFYFNEKIKKEAEKYPVIIQKKIFEYLIID